MFQLSSATFLEIGRVEFLHDPEHPMARDGAEFVAMHRWRAGHLVRPAVRPGC